MDEINKLLYKQIEDRNKIIELLMEERKEKLLVNKTTNGCIMVLAIMFFIVIITMTLSYFFADFSNVNINTNENNIKEKSCVMEVI